MIGSIFNENNKIFIKITFTSDIIHNFPFFKNQSFSNWLSDGRFLLLSNTNYFIENICIKDPFIHKINDFPNYPMCLDIENNFLYFYFENSLCYVHIRLYNEKNKNLFHLPHNLWKKEDFNNEFIKLNISSNLKAHYGIILLDKISEYSSWSFFETIHYNLCINKLFYEILKNLSFPLLISSKKTKKTKKTSSSNQKYNLSILLAFLRLMKYNLIHYNQKLNQLKQNSQINIEIINQYHSLFIRIIKYLQKKLINQNQNQNHQNLELYYEIYSQVNEIYLIPIWWNKILHKDQDKNNKSKLLHLFHSIASIENKNIWENIFQSIRMDLLSITSFNEFYSHYLIQLKDQLIILWKENSNKLSGDFFIEIFFILFNSYMILSLSDQRKSNENNNWSSTIIQNYLDSNENNDFIQNFLFKILIESLDQINNTKNLNDLNHSLLIKKLLPSFISQFWNTLQFNFENNKVLVQLLIQLLTSIQSIIDKNQNNFNENSFDNNIYQIKSKIIETAHPYLLENHDDDIEKYYSICYPGADLIVLKFSSDSNLGPNDEIQFFDNHRDRNNIDFYYYNKQMDQFNINLHKTIYFSNDNFTMFFYGGDENFYGFKVELNAFYYNIDNNNNKNQFSYLKDLQKSLATICGKKISTIIQFFNETNSSTSIVDGSTSSSTTTTSNQIHHDNISQFPLSCSWINEKESLFNNGIQLDNKKIYSENFTFLLQIIKQNSPTVIKLIHILKNLSSNIVLGNSENHPKLLEMEILVFTCIIHHCGLSSMAQHFALTLDIQSIEDLDESELSSLVFLWNQSQYIREWAFKQYHDSKISYEILCEKVIERTNFLNNFIIPIHSSSGQSIKRRNLNNTNQTSLRKRRRRSSLKMSASKFFGDIDNNNNLNNTSGSGDFLSKFQRRSSLRDPEKEDLKKEENFSIFMDKLSNIQSRQSIASSPASKYINICSTIILWITKISNHEIVEIENFLKNQISRCTIRTMGYKYLHEFLQIPSISSIMNFCLSKLTVPQNPLFNLKYTNIEIREQLIQQYYELIDYLLPLTNENYDKLKIETLYLCTLSISSLRDFHLIKKKLLLKRFYELIMYYCKNHQQCDTSSTDQSIIINYYNLKYILYLFSSLIIKCVQFISNNFMDTAKDKILTLVFIDITNFLICLLTNSNKSIQMEIIDLLFGIREYFTFFSIGYEVSQKKFIITLLKLLTSCHSNEKVKIIQILFYQLKTITPATFTHILIELNIPSTLEWFCDLYQLIGNYMIHYHYSNIQKPSFDKKNNEIQSIKRRRKNMFAPSIKFHSSEDFINKFDDGKSYSLLTLINTLQYNQSDCRRVIREFIWMIQNLYEFQRWRDIFDLLNNKSWNYFKDDQLLMNNQELIIGYFSILGGFYNEILSFDDICALSSLCDYRFNCLSISFLNNWFIVSTKSLQFVPCNFVNLLNSPNNNLLNSPNNNFIDSSVIKNIFIFLKSQLITNSLTINITLRILLQLSSKLLSITDDKSTTTTTTTSQSNCFFNTFDIFNYLKQLIHLNSFIINDDICILNHNLCYLRNKLSNIPFIKKLEISDILNIIKSDLPFSICSSDDNHHHHDDGKSWILNPFELMIPSYLFVYNNTYRFISKKISRQHIYLKGNYPIHLKYYNTYYFENKVNKLNSDSRLKLGFIKMKEKQQNSFSSSNSLGGIDICISKIGEIIFHVGKVCLHLAFKDNDIIGCGFVFFNNLCHFYFTVNGITHSDEMIFISMNQFDIIYPIIIVDHSPVEVDINFGQSSFHFIDQFLEFKNNLLKSQDNNPAPTSTSSKKQEEDSEEDFEEEEEDEEETEDSSSSEDLFNNDESEEELELPSYCISDNFPDIDKHISNLISELYENVSLSEKSLSKPKINPFWTVNEYKPNAFDINKIFIGDIIGQGLGNQKNFRIGIVKDISIIRNCVFIDFINCKEWISLPNLIIFPYLNPSNDSLEKQIEMNEISLTQKLSCKVFSILSPKLTLTDIFGESIISNELQNVDDDSSSSMNLHDENFKVFALLCQEYITIPLQEKLDYFYKTQSGQVTPIIAPELQNIFNQIKNLILEDFTKNENQPTTNYQICNKFLQFVKNKILSMMELKICTYNKKDIFKQISENILEIHCFSSEMVIFSIDDDEIYPNIYLDKECTIKIGNINNRFHCNTNKVYLHNCNKEQSKSIQIYPRGKLLSIPNNYFDFSFIWGSCMLIIDILKESKNQSIIDDFIDDKLILSLMNDFLPEEINSNRIGVDSHLLFLIHYFLSLKSVSVSEKCKKQIQKQIIPFILYNINTIDEEYDLTPLSPWNNSCFEFFMWHNELFTYGNDFSFNLLSYRTFFATNALLSIDPLHSNSSLFTETYFKLIAGKCFAKTIEKESSHPCRNSFQEEIVFPDAMAIIIVFDQRSFVKHLEIFKAKGSKALFTEYDKYSQVSIFFIHYVVKNNMIILNFVIFFSLLKEKDAKVFFLVYYLKSFFLFNFKI